MDRPRLLAVAALLVAAACSSSGGTGSSSAGPTPALVIGQPDFTSAAADRGGAVSAAGVHFPVGDASLASGSLLLPDTYNHRLLVYRALPRTNGAPADAVLGQADAGSRAPSYDAGGLNYPQSVWSSGAGTLVADTGSSRVVFGAGRAPWVLGWGAEATHRWGCAADRLSEPSRAITVAGKLIVADRSNHRVLVWNEVPKSDGTPADLVLGQKDFTHCASNDMLGSGTSGGRSARTLSYPTDVWSDGTRLLVVDQGNNRVLLWSRFPTESRTAADLVLGQADFLTGSAETSQAGLQGPSAVASDGRSIFVADSRNHRVLRWRSFPTGSGMPADQVLGQADFTHGAANDADGDGASDAGPSAGTFSYPTGVTLAGDALVVTDTYNHRFVVYRGF